MDFETVKKFMTEAGWGFLATSDGNKVGVRPMGSCVWVGNESRGLQPEMDQRKPCNSGSSLCIIQVRYCFSDRDGKHVRIQGVCTISTNNDDKLKLYVAVPVLKKILQRS